MRFSDAVRNGGEAYNLSQAPGLQPRQNVRFGISELFIQWASTDFRFTPLYDPFAPIPYPLPPITSPLSSLPSHLSPILFLIYRLVHQSLTNHAVYSISLL
jgi:hypothetical protein